MKRGYGRWTGGGNFVFARGGMVVLQKKLESYAVHDGIVEGVKQSVKTFSECKDLPCLKFLNAIASWP